MKTPDYRTKSEVLAGARWDPMIGDPNISNATVLELRLVDDFLAFLERPISVNGNGITADVFLRFDQKNNSQRRLRALKFALMSIFPGHPSILHLEEAIRQREPKRSRKGHSSPRRLNVSVPFDTLPLPWKEAFADMDAGFDRNGQMPPAPGMMGTHKMKVRQLLFSAREAALPDEISTDTVRAYARDMSARNLAAATLRASFSAILKFARYISTDHESIQLLEELTRIYDRKARRTKSKKFQHLQNTGYSPVAVIEQAQTILDEAPKILSPRSRHAHRNQAAALAIFSVLPVRLADTRLIFGETLFWNGNRYTIEMTLSKSSYHWETELDPRLNIFIDALILRGCNPIWLDEMRDKCLQEHRALFITNDGSPVAYNYVSDCWRQVVGTGEHIARTILHTFMGIKLGEAGTDLAMAATGQRSHATAVAYQGDALAMAQRVKGQTELSDVAKEFDPSVFEFS
ncbi:hypothetical protein K3X44_05845 [Aliiroseovarius crassostreae]|uniref:hypothetical protein n=1 Tax=Aliiroseovarius crassostreae TaxID=154981 RepID=UPI00220077A5|nr:hypothetical protein [Aliiroseovarius crassostreae]UWQ02842.1 hypothetical protein K3X44_05845 [Aliiroseovarius crassostreae]